jgi:hypothetical protein
VSETVSGEDVERATPFCSELTRAVGEPMIGSAPKDARNVVAIAYDGAWAREPLPASTLSDVAKGALDALVKAVPRTRVVFVRRAGEASPPTVFLAHAADPPRPVLRGMPIYEALLGDSRVETWITSHLGGHRFAPILLSLPDGHSYGRMVVGEIRAFVDALLAGRIHDVTKLRGRAGLDEPVQAAEVLVRIREGFDRHDAVRALAANPSEGGTTVRLATPRGELEVTVRKRPLPGLRPTSCGDEPSPAFAYELA